MKIEIVQYNLGWPEDFNSERRWLNEKLGNRVDKIHHIGSTSVEGLAAKPIIDIILEVTSLEVLDKAESALKSLGYEAKGEFGIPGRRYFRKGGYNRTHQIHAFKTGDINIIRHLAFRDYLRAHPDITLEYQKLKVQLAKSCGNDIDCYCDGKKEFIDLYEMKALDWLASI